MQTRLLAFFLVTSLAAVASGCYVASHAGVAASLWLRNLAAWAVGALVAWGISRVSPEMLLRVAMVLTPLALLASLFSAGQDGVHRWISLGAFRVHAAFLLLPAFTVALARWTHPFGSPAGSRWVWGVALTVQFLLCLQPDASQATALGVAVLALWIPSPRLRWTRLQPGHGLAAMAAAMWFLPDPLAPVPEVEGILELANGISPVLAGVCGLSMLASAIVPPVACRKANPQTHRAARALCVYFLACVAMPFVGAFPVPLAGMGVSPILGFWLGLGALGAVCREDEAGRPREATLNP